MKLRRKWLGAPVVAVCLILLVVGGIYIWSIRGPTVYHPPEVRRLLDELREPSVLEEWLIRLGLRQRRDQRHGYDVLVDLVSLDQEAVPALAEALEDRDASVRCWAAWALGAIGPGAKEAVPALKGALRDEDEDVRFAAGAALVKLGLPDKGLPVLIALLGDESVVERMRAASTLGDIGAPAKGAIPALTKALKDETPSVRKTAAEALKKIQAAPATRKAVE